MSHDRLVTLRVGCPICKEQWELVEQHTLPHDARIVCPKCEEIVDANFGADIQTTVD